MSRTVRSWRPLIRGGPADSLLLIAVSGFGSGLSPIVPGTVGTLFAVGAVLAVPVPVPWIWLAAGVLAFVAGVPLVEAVERRLGLDDPGWIVLDEVAAFWAMVGVLGVLDFPSLLALFFLFRIFDIWKPWPIRTLERRLSGGLGVMMDDLLAALYAGLVYLVLTPGAG